MHRRRLRASSKLFRPTEKLETISMPQGRSTNLYQVRRAAIWQYQMLRPRGRPSWIHWTKSSALLLFWLCSTEEETNMAQGILGARKELTATIERWPVSARNTNNYDTLFSCKVTYYMIQSLRVLFSFRLRSLVTGINLGENSVR